MSNFFATNVPHWQKYLRDNRVLFIDDIESVSVEEYYIWECERFEK